MNDEGVHATLAIGPPEKGSLQKSVNEFERMLLLVYLEHCQWNKCELARRLGLHPNTILNKCKKHGIEPRHGPQTAGPHDTRSKPNE